MTGAKMSDAMMGKEHTAETCAKMSEAMVGKEKTADHRAKMSEAMMGKEKTADHRAKLSKVMTGKKTISNNGDVSKIYHGEHEPVDLTFGEEESQAHDPEY
jgi:hypothetical protein